MKTGRLLLGGIVGCALAAAASADILFNNFGNNDSYNCCSGMTIGLGDMWEQGNGFTMTADGDYFLDSIEAAIGFVAGVNQLFLDVYDDAGGLPGNLLETAVLTDLPQFGAGEAPTTWVYSGSTVLQEGQQYYVIARSNNDGNSWLAFSMNDIGDQGPRVGRNANQGWSSGQSTRGAMRVNGSAVPLPGTLLCMGVAGAVARRRRRRN